MAEDGGEELRKWQRVNESVHWSDAVGEAICARTAAGESLREICRSAGMPRLPTICRWAREKAEFGEALDAARAEAGRPFRRFGQSTYCEETAEVIFDRLSAGEGLIRICRDPDMPTAPTVRRWAKEHEAFGAAMEIARDIQAEVYFERGMAWCEAVTPATAQAAKVQLAHLRWHAGKLAPKRFGNLKPAEQAAEGTGGGGAVTNVYLKTWVIDPEGGPPRESDRPAELLYSARHGTTRGEPAVVTRGPASGEGQAEEQADRARANGEAAAAARAAGMVRLNGGIPTRFWPAWHREKYPQAWADDVALERYVARSRIKARASHRLGPEAEDLIQAGWTAEEAAERHPVRGAGIDGAAAAEAPSTGFAGAAEAPSTGFAGPPPPEGEEWL